MNKVEPLIEAASVRVREHVPSLIQRIGWTYLPPIFAVLLINAFGWQILANVIPASTASLLVIIANVAVLVYGWRYLEKRYGGMSRYMQFLYFTKERRELRRLVKEDESDIPALTLQTLKMEQAADEFIRAMTPQA
jgi:hypothetical protein